VTKNPRDVILKPVVSEKSYALLDENTLPRKGKRKRTRRTLGVRKATQRALVTRHPDDKIEIVEAR
jgi:large subunit ribosomal protein L23